MEKKLNLFSSKIYLCKTFSIKDFITINEDPIAKLISNYKEIKSILNDKDKNMIKFLYYNRKQFHEILYNEEELINLNENEQNKNLYYYFYLFLLINENRDIMNYIYDFKYIENKYQILLNEKSQLKQIILSRIFIQLIDNFKCSEEYMDEDDENEKLDNILRYCEIAIEKNIDAINKYNLEKNDIQNKNIDDIYIQIIIWLIKNNKFEDYDYSYNIINDLDLENINITNNMFIELSKILNEKDIIKRYEILEENDLLDINKINFFYILLKYILKSPIYIYHNYFLSKTRKNIISFIKSKSTLNINDNNIKLKIEYIIHIFLDSLYYSHNIFILNKDKLDEFDTYSKTQDVYNYNSQMNSSFNNIGLSFNDSYLSNISKKSFKSNYNEDENQIVKNIEDETWLKILDNCCFQIEIIKYKNKYFFDYKDNKINEIKQYEGFFKDNQNKSYYYEYYKKILYFLRYLEKNFKKELKDNIKFNIEIKLVNKKDNFFNIDCIYNYKNPEDKYVKIFKDSNILNEKNEKKFYDGFNFLVAEINSNYDLLKLEDIKIFDDYSFNNDDNKYSLLKFEKIIGKQEERVECIKELNNGYYIIGSSDHKLSIYNELYERKINNIKLSNFKDSIYMDSICQINNNLPNENEIQIFACSKTDLNLIKINTNNFIYEKYTNNLDNIHISQCIEMKKNNYILVGNNGAYHINGKPSKIISNLKNKDVNITIIFKDKNYINGIKINENLVALSSNNVKRKGEDKLLFYDLNKKAITHEIKGFSFINSLNGLSLMKINNKNNESIFVNEILLCGCKKYLSNQKNGILLVEPQLKDNSEVYHSFYETDYEVNCFCPIINIQKDNGIINKNIEIIKTNHFLVGGYDNIKRKGILKLYKLIFDEKDCHIKIDNISDIYVEGYESEKGEEILNSINCIIQSKKDGKILISCDNDKNAYLFGFIG